MHNIYEIERLAQETPKARRAEAQNERMVRMARANANSEAGRKPETVSRKTLRAGNLPSRLIQMLKG